MDIIREKIEKKYMKQVLPDFRPGDTVRVHFKIREGNRERVQIFEGVVIARKGSGVNETFTVRKISYGVGVERVFPVHSPRIEKIQIVSRGRVRRAKLYYLRERVGKKAKLQAMREADISRERVYFEHQEEVPAEESAPHVQEDETKTEKSPEESGEG